MIPLVANVLVLTGVLILGASLLTVRKITRRLPLGRSRSSWYAMAGLVVLFICGYLGYTAMFWSSQTSLLDLLVPGVFFFGGCFVWLSSYLALQTALDVRRITVLEHETLTDPLTGMYNRRFMQQRLKEEVSKAQRYGFSLAVLLLDLDRFKHINDEYGHPAGDRLLVEIAGLLGHELRDSDILARYGGEEFLIIAPNTHQADALLFAERLRSRIESRNFLPDLKNTQGLDIRMTVSIGVASFGAGADDEESLVAVADRNLYRAKNGGRNLVVSNNSGKSRENPGSNAA